MYNDPNFNVIVLSPGRTGSTLITRLFSHVTKLTPFIRQHIDNKKPMAEKQILHSHTLSDINLGNEHTFYIISTRNMIESTFSNLIGLHTKHWEYYKNQPIDIDSFHVSVQEFLGVYKKTSEFYKNLNTILPKKYRVIDYSEFKDNFENLFDILSISKKHLKFANKNFIPIKTPGLYKDWIVNYDEIYSYAQTLDPNPSI